MVTFFAALALLLLGYLTYGKVVERIFGALMGAVFGPGDKYPAEDWDDAVAYVLETGRPPRFSTVAEARTYCRARLDGGETARDDPKEKRTATNWLHRRRERPPAARADAKNGFSRKDADTEIGSE